MRAGLDAHQDPARTRPPRSVARRVRIERRDIDEHAAYTLSPRGGVRSDLHVVHLHGGGFVEQPETHHWRFAQQIATAWGCRFTLFMYPLAPAHDFAEISATTRHAYRALTADTPPGRAVLFGDSAGGSLSLGIAQELRDRDEAQPACICLFSPWLDLATDHELSVLIDRHDPELGIEGLQQAGRWYANGRDLHDPEISPQDADLSGIADIIVFVGTRDLLLPDALHLRARARDAGGRVDLHLADGMFHNWIMTPIPEARPAREQLARFVAEHAAGD